MLRLVHIRYHKLVFKYHKIVYKCRKIVFKYHKIVFTYHKILYIDIAKYLGRCPNPIGIMVWKVELAIFCGLN